MIYIKVAIQWIPLLEEYSKYFFLFTFVQSLAKNFNQDCKTLELENGTEREVPLYDEALRKLNNGKNFQKGLPNKVEN